jgi:hypothetical protein
MEPYALHLHLTLAHLLGGHDEHGSEDLFSQVPVLARAPPSDVAGAEHPIRHNPGVLDPFAGLPRVERNRYVQPAAHARQPPAAGQIPEQACGAGAIELQESRCLSDGECAPEPVQLFEVRSVVTTDAGDGSQDDEISIRWLLLRPDYTDTSRTMYHPLDEHYRTFTVWQRLYSTRPRH